MKNSILYRRLTRLAGSACAVFLVGGVCTSCSDDLLTGTPSWLGNSIYEELQHRGNFNETLKLINAQEDDCVSVLSKTGSKTVFVADDAAWQQFYETNPWGAKSIDDLTPAQKKLLYRGNIINSAYLVELLGNIPSADANVDPMEGSCMRRMTDLNIMDSVPLVPNSKFPIINPARLDPMTGNVVDYWSRIRGKESVLLLQDDGVSSMIHFMPKFMQVNNITDSDVSFLTNGEITSAKGAFVNGKEIRENTASEVNHDITCQNGYIHILEGVAVSLDNIANVIASDPDFSIYKRLLDRFSYPSYDSRLSDEYHRLYGGEDSVFVKRYFNDHGSHSFKARDNQDGGTVVGDLLPYDPGWNLYTLYSASGITYQYDAAAMLVPTDAAMMAYLETDGADLQERYANAGPGATAWDNAPDEVVLPLLKNTMLTSLKSAIPSQFASINNTASEPMGVKKEDVERVLWGCNGVVYKTNKVYVAPEYVSVFYPCVVRKQDDLLLTYQVVSNDNKVAGGEGFYAYLNNMGSDYSFIIPTDNALQTYYDPVSFNRTDANGKSTAVAYKFYLNSDLQIAATAPLVDWTTTDEKGRGRILATNYDDTPKSSTGSNGDVFNHFKDILNSSLSVGLFVPGQKFYTARNGGPLIVQWTGDKVTGVAGSFQYERGYYIPVIEEYDKSKEGNGRSYIIDEEPLMSTATSPYTALNDPEMADHFGVFASLLDGMDMISTNDGSNHVTMDKSLTNLNNFNYTIYAPSNESVQELITSHKLPTWEDVDAVENCIKGASALSEEDEAYLVEQMAEMKLVISNFVNYHIQDYSVYVDGAPLAHDVFESACLDTMTTRFYKVYVDYTPGGQMHVTDNCGNVRIVDRDVNNILTRQYYFNGSNLKGTSCTQIYSSSFAVIHKIDAPLIPSNTSYYDPKAYERVMAIVASNSPGGGSSPVKRYRK